MTTRRTDAAADRLAVLLEGIRDAAGGIQTLFVREQPFIPSLENVDVRSAVGLIATIASNLSEALPARDEETSHALRVVEERWQELVLADGPVSDATYDELEQFASAYALMFFYEIRRLERLWAAGRLRVHDDSAADRTIPDAGEVRTMKTMKRMLMLFAAAAVAAASMAAPSPGVQVTLTIPTEALTGLPCH